MTFNYVDISSFCFIDIDSESWRGDRSTIKKALTTIKHDDPPAYITVCKYIDIINEKRCLPGDSRGDSSYVAPDIDGCFLRGTHVVYIKPNRSTSQKAVQNRADQIALYSTFAQEFWEIR